MKKARSHYQQMLRKGELPKGYNRQGLAFGGENVPENIQFTGETTIRHSELEGLDTSFYHENVYGKKDPKVLKIHQREVDYMYLEIIQIILKSLISKMKY
ncbi:Uncharacterised protein [Streptococcus cristatus]|uniref:Uncharacterized protein n=2 Tax=Streptococcus cristatus TaxID=45634 RepID=A0A512ACY2_STRCR|nr:hypothetical protein [Streptococcus cristatus]AGK72122.1 hypothetical protein I872_10240 [Streptococcus cristatus AS 1.3089]GEN97561.1 hypothetical protein SOL01_14350 [Streptococcus cristatus]SQI50243.1 Uncharacterised protein [Streptococcus cristatus]